MNEDKRRELLKNNKLLRPRLVEERDMRPGEEESGEVSKKRAKVPMPLLVLVIGVLVIVGIATVLSNRTYRAYEILAAYEIDDVTSMEYEAYGDNYIKYSKDGISYVDKENNTVWTESYAMKMPVAVISGDYIAVADLNGNEVFLFGPKGKESKTTTQYTIVDVDVASQGVYAVVLDGQTKHLVITYDKAGEKIAEISTTVQSSGYPLDISLSHDGRKLFTSYISVQDMQLKNQLGTYNFGEVGQNENADRFMGGFDTGDTLVSKVAFLDNDSICAFGDNCLKFYSMKEKPSEVVSVPYEEEIQSIFYNTAYAGTICKKEGEVNAYVIRAYNTKGREVTSIDMDIAYSHVHATTERIIVVGDSDCRIYDYNGREVFRYSFSKKLLNLIPTADAREYIAVYENGSEVIRLVSSAAGQNETDRTEAGQTEAGQTEVGQTEADGTEADGTEEE